MVLSMTAFARIEASCLVWEVRSVNHRFLEMSFRMPDTLREIEHPLREFARSALNRGKVDATLRVDTRDDQFALDINRPILLTLLATLERIRRDAPEIGHPDPLDLLRWPGVIGQEEGEQAELLKSRATSAFEDAVGLLIEHRRSEGGKLDELLRAKLGEVDVIVAEVKTLTRSLASSIREKLIARIDDLIKNVDSDRLEQEIAFLAQKADVAEELDRLVIHVAECRKSLDTDGPQGRRLDFLMQELNREANTLASKSISSECSKRAVDLKVIIEQMREQVQNVE